jgi:hypothetical protein
MASNRPPSYRLWIPLDQSQREVSFRKSGGLDNIRSLCGAASAPPAPTAPGRATVPSLTCQTGLHSHDRQVADLVPSVLHLARPGLFASPDNSAHWWRGLRPCRLSFSPGDALRRPCQSGGDAGGVGGGDARWHDWLGRGAR